jgi:hypothetical protein
MGQQRVCLAHNESSREIERRREEHSPTREMSAALASACNTRRINSSGRCMIVVAPGMYTARLRVVVSPGLLAYMFAALCFFFFFFFFWSVPFGADCVVSMVRIKNQEPLAEGHRFPPFDAKKGKINVDRSKERRQTQPLAGDWMGVGECGGRGGGEADLTHLQTGRRERKNGWGGCNSHPPSSSSSSPFALQQSPSPPLPCPKRLAGLTDGDEVRFFVGCGHLATPAPSLHRGKKTKKKKEGGEGGEEKKNKQKI